MRYVLPVAMFAAAVVVLLGVACGGSAAGNDPQETITGTPSVSVTAAPSPAGSKEPRAIPPATTDGLVEHPLDELSQEATAYMATRDGPIGVAVVVPSRGAIYTANGDQLFHMASVAKVAIMVTVMDKAVQEGRGLTEREIALLEPMITVSDNNAATALWYEVGGAEGVGAYLRSIDLTTIEPNALNCWGASYAPAKEVALLLAKLANDEILDEPSRALALELMSRVDPSQSWGAIAGVPDLRPDGTLIGIKDGWYPADCGWWVNSAGVILPGNDKPAYTIAVLTAEQSSLGYAIETIEGIAELLHGELHG